MTFSKLRTLAFAAALMVPMSAWALDLQQAKTNGWVGETPKGFIAQVGAAPADALRLVETINAKRLEEYKKISLKQNQPVDVVARLMGEKLYERAAPGEYLQQPNGSWAKK
ncbi:DUF1318 domain-containing protein [bacterium]|nr:DUF1318 domain-containing protein [bacterium]